MVICLEQGADLHMAQLMPLPFAVSYFRKIQIGFTLYRLTRVVPDKGPLNRCECVCVLLSQDTSWEESLRNDLFCVQSINLLLLRFSC